MEDKKSFNADALSAGIVIGLGLVVVDLISALMKWELNDVGMPRNLLILAVIIAGTIFFTRKRAELAGDAGMTYGQCLGFMAMSMLYAGILVGIGDVILYKMVMPGYYNEVIDDSLKASSKILKSNPLFADNKAQLTQSIEISRMMLTNPVFIIFRNIMNVMILGVLVGLFTSIFCKRPADPLHTQEDEQQA